MEIFGISQKKIIQMEYSELAACILNASGLPVEKLAAELVQMRRRTESDAGKLAVNRILSALIGGPDVLDY